MSNSNPYMTHPKQLVENLKGLTELSNGVFNTYALKHYYSSVPNRKEYVVAPYDLDTFNAILAYIQFECAEHDMSYSMDEKEVVEVLLSFYGCVDTGAYIRVDAEIDLYYNWEMFCGSGIQSVESLKREGMSEVLSTYVERFNKVNSV